MPTYQYACTDCAERLEVVQKFSDDSLTVCASCGGRLRKVFSPVGIVFKGSGFYRNDSRKSAEPAVASSSGPDSKKSDTASGGDSSSSAGSSADKSGKTDKGGKSGKNDKKAGGTVSSGSSSAGSSSSSGSKVA